MFKEQEAKRLIKGFNTAFNLKGVEETEIEDNSEMQGLKRIFEPNFAVNFEIRTQCSNIVAIVTKQEDSMRITVYDLPTRVPMFRTVCTSILEFHNTLLAEGVVPL